jgi:hypothetical protein
MREVVAVRYVCDICGNVEIGTTDGSPQGWLDRGDVILQFPATTAPTIPPVDHICTDCADNKCLTSIIVQVYGKVSQQ